MDQVPGPYPRSSSCLREGDGHIERKRAGGRTRRGKKLGAGTWDVGYGMWDLGSGTWETDPLP